MSDRIRHAIRKAWEHYQLSGNECGGMFHIVLDDGNVGDDSVRWCIEHASDYGHEDDAGVGPVLLDLSVLEREILYCNYGQYHSDAREPSDTMEVWMPLGGE